MLWTVVKISLHNFFCQYIIMLDVDCNMSTVNVRISSLTHVFIIHKNKIFYTTSTYIIIIKKISIFSVLPIKIPGIHYFAHIQK